MNTLKNKKFPFKKLFKIGMIVFSVYLLYILAGIYLNASLGLKYGIGTTDIEYGILYSKVLMVYIILVIVILITNHSVRQ